MTAVAAQVSIFGMTGRRKPSTPSAYRREFIERVKSARVMSGKEPKQVAAELGVRFNTYQTWETRTLMPHQCLIPFCEVTGSDPYFLLTGTPFSLGRTPPRRPRPDA